MVLECVDSASDIVTGAFSRFSHADVITMSSLRDGLNILELFHGPSLAFKDLALTLVGRLYSHFLSRRRRHVNVVIGSSTFLPHAPQIDINILHVL